MVQPQPRTVGRTPFCPLFAYKNEHVPGSIVAGMAMSSLKREDWVIRLKIAQDMRCR
jgi:hypothetical protein